MTFVLIKGMSGTGESWVIDEFALVVYYVETVEQMIKRGSTDEIDTSVPLDDVVGRVLEIAESR